MSLQNSEALACLCGVGSFVNCQSLCFLLMISQYHRLTRKTVLLVRAALIIICFVCRVSQKRLVLRQSTALPPPAAVAEVRLSTSALGIEVIGYAEHHRRFPRRFETVRLPIRMYISAAAADFLIVVAANQQRALEVLSLDICRTVCICCVSRRPRATVQ